MIIKIIQSQNNDNIKSCIECNCDINCTLCNEPIKNYKYDIFNKKSFIYVSGNQQSNYTYFRDDKSIKWNSIDIISLYSKNYDKRISCLAHKNNVKVLFIYEESSICPINKDPNCIWDQSVIEKQLPKILSTLETNGVDGINLDFEVNNRYGQDKQYATLLKLINDYLKSKNPNYIVSSAVSLRFKDNFKNQIVEVLENSDYLTIMAYDLNSNQKGINFTQYPNSPIGVRSDLKKFYIDRVPTQYLHKIILILPFYGYITKCKSNLSKSNYDYDNGLFSNECIIDEFKPKQLSYKEIDTLIYNKYNSNNNNNNKLNINLNIYNNNNNININENNNIVLSSGVLYDSSHLIPFANLIDSQGDRYQIVFDSPFSIYSKTLSIGIGGVGCWSIDKIRGISLQSIDSFYYSIKKENIGNNFILNPYY